MTRICENCKFENQDDYDFCAKCGTPLVEGVQPKNFIVFRNELPPVNNKAIIASYIVTIFLSWSGFIVGTFLKNTSLSFFTFFGFFMPFYLVQSRHPTIRKHGIVMLIISLVGVALSFYTVLHK
jgi:hypothetical protein